MTKFLFLAITLLTINVVSQEIAVSGVDSLEIVKEKSESEKNSAPAKHTYKKHNIGVGAGFVSGVGILYKRWFDNGQGVKLTFIPIFKSEDKHNDAESFLSVGLNGLYCFAENKRTAYFIYYGGSVLFDDYLLNDIHGSYAGHAGGGVGIELHIQRATLELASGFVGWWKKERLTSYDKSSSGYYSDREEINIGSKQSYGFHPDISVNLTFGFGEF